MPSAHCVSTADGIIIAADQGFLDLVMRPEADVIGMSYRTITHPADLDRSARMISALIDKGPPIRLRKRYLRPDGTTITANLLVTRFAEPNRLVSTLFWREAGRFPSPARLWEAAVRFRHVQACRREQFGDDLFTDGVGLMLISAYLAEAEGRLVSLSSLAQDAGVSFSTVTRWTHALQQRGIIQATEGLNDAVQLSHEGLTKVEAVLGSAFHSSGLRSRLP